MSRSHDECSSGKATLPSASTVGLHVTVSNMRIIYLFSNKLHSIVIFYKQHIKTYVLSKTLNFSYMFRSLSDHPQGDTIFVLTLVTKIIDVACCYINNFSN